MDLMRLSFSDGRIVEYSAEDADLIEHAYATTVHKSQGSEYKVVIIPWLPMFYMMLRRNILYTAITRAKEKIVIVGSKKALYQAIHNTAWRQAKYPSWRADRKGIQRTAYEESFSMAVEVTNAIN